jgi:hypothetical protein
MENTLKIHRSSATTFTDSIKLKQDETRYQYHVKCLITIPHLPMERTHTQPQTFILAVWPFRIPTWLPTLGRRWVAIVGPVGWQLMDRTVGFPWSLVQSDAEGKTKGIGMSICKGYLKQQGPNVQGTGVRTIKMY